MKNMFYTKTNENCDKQIKKYRDQMQQKHRHQIKHSSFSIPYKELYPYFLR